MGGYIELARGERDREGDRDAGMEMQGYGV